MKKELNKMIAGILAASICLITAACGNNVEEGDGNGDSAIEEEMVVLEDEGLVVEVKEVLVAIFSSDTNLE